MRHSVSHCLWHVSRHQKGDGRYGSRIYSFFLCCWAISSCTARFQFCAFDCTTATLVATVVGTSEAKTCQAGRCGSKTVHESTMMNIFKYIYIYIAYIYIQYIICITIIHIQLWVKLMKLCSSKLL